MPTDRDEMASALKRVVVPSLKELGFRGAFPHFRRPVEGRVDLLTFQFSSWGGKFAVEIARAPADGVEVGGKIVPPEKVQVRHVMDRKRLGPKDADGDHWFLFESAEPEAVAASVIPYLKRQGERWWSRA